MEDTVDIFRLEDVAYDLGFRFCDSQTSKIIHITNTCDRTTSGTLCRSSTKVSKLHTSNKNFAPDVICRRCKIFYPKKLKYARLGIFPERRPYRPKRKKKSWKKITFLLDGVPIRESDQKAMDVDLYCYEELDLVPVISVHKEPPRRRAGVCWTCNRDFGYGCPAKCPKCVRKFHVNCVSIESGRVEHLSYPMRQPCHICQPPLPEPPVSAATEAWIQSLFR